MRDRTLTKTVQLSKARSSDRARETPKLVRGGGVGQTVNVFGVFVLVCLKYRAKQIANGFRDECWGDLLNRNGRLVSEWRERDKKSIRNHNELNNAWMFVSECVFQNVLSVGLISQFSCARSAAVTMTWTPRFRPPPPTSPRPPTLFACACAPRRRST